MEPGNGYLRRLHTTVYRLIPRSQSDPNPDFLHVHVYTHFGLFCKAIIVACGNVYMEFGSVPFAQTTHYLRYILLASMGQVQLLT